MIRNRSNIRPYNGEYPGVGQKVYVADTALVIGNVILEDESSVWFHSVLRGDINSIYIGKRTNLQDGTVVHVDHGKDSVHIGDDVTIGHNATIHGCVIESRCLIGMGATILSGAKIETGVIVAAGALVLENQVIPSGSLVAGVPAKPIRDVTEKEREQIMRSAQRYVSYSKNYI